MKKILKQSKPDYFPIIAICVVSVVLLGIVIWLAGSNSVIAEMPADRPSLKKASFAGGCFWCMEPPFEKLPGVKSVISGYTGGEMVDPSYKQVASGRTDHLEAVQIQYDPGVIRYEDLLAVFWRNINPTDDGGQFVDRGKQYRTAIFYHDETQKKTAERSKQELSKSGRFEKEIVTPIRKAGTFYPAEKYHQDFYKKSTARYKSYRSHSGRDQFLDRVWGDDREYKLPERAQPTADYKNPSDTKLKEILTPLQYRVTRKNGTEPAFKNTYWDNKKAGIYVDVVSGEPLFSSKDKFKSGTGWPSFTKPLVPSNVVNQADRSLGMMRTEVRSKHADSHLGHVFKDGPEPTGLRYCINSAALRFVPADRLKEEGYPEFVDTFAE